MLPWGCCATKYNNPLSEDRKYLEFEVDWELKKQKTLKELKFENTLAKPCFP